jgi:hypothetical protein
MKDLIVPTDEYSALTMHDVVPAGCIAVLVDSDAFEPHLHAGEFAIVDTTDKERQVGELYVITIENRARGPKPTIVELIKGFRRNDVSPIGVWYAFSFSRRVALGGGQYGRMVDGPLGFEHWPDKCRGRVVGVMAPARGGRHG